MANIVINAILNGDDRALKCLIVRHPYKDYSQIKT